MSLEQMAIVQSAMFSPTFLVGKELDPVRELIRNTDYI